MKRRMRNDVPRDRGPGKASNPEGKVRIKDPGHLAAKPTGKKAEKADVNPTRSVPADKGTGTKVDRRKLRNIRI